MSSKRIYERFFLVLLAAFIVDYTFSASQLNGIAPIHDCLFAVRYAVLISAICLIGLKNERLSYCVFVACLLMLYAAISNLLVLEGNLGVLVLLIIAWASCGVRMDRVFKVSICAYGVSCGIIIISCLIGVTEDEVSVRTLGEFAGIFSGSYVRHSYGFEKGNQIPMALFALYLMLIAYRKSEIRWHENMIILIINIIVFMLCGSRAIFCLMVAACLLYLACQVRSRNANLARNPRMVCCPFFFMSFFICAIASIILAIDYGQGGQFAAWANMHLNNRLLLTSDVLGEYGIRLFGIARDIGTTAFGATVDNGYLLVLLNQGAIVEVGVIASLSYLTWHAERQGNVFLVLVLVLLSLAEVINSTLTLHSMIPFYCMLFNLDDPLLCSERTASNTVKKVRALAQ